MLEVSVPRTQLDTRGETSVAFTGVLWKWQHYLLWNSLLQQLISRCATLGLNELFVRGSYATSIASTNSNSRLNRFLIRRAGYGTLPVAAASKLGNACCAQRRRTLRPFSPTTREDYYRQSFTNRRRRVNHVEISCKS